MAKKPTTSTDAAATPAPKAAAKPAAKPAAAVKPAAAKAVAAPAAKAAAKPAAPAKVNKPKAKVAAHAGKPSLKAVAKSKIGGSSKSAKGEEVKGTRVGIVESDSRPQTRRVVISFSSKHPKYGKYIRQRTVLHVHDAKNESKLGDVVEVMPCRPVSKTKRWALVKVVERRSAAAAALANAKQLSN
jgi:small subunit ribosomal protein S17